MRFLGKSLRDNLNRRLGNRSLYSSCRRVMGPKEISCQSGSSILCCFRCSACWGRRSRPSSLMAKADCFLTNPAVQVIAYRCIRLRHPRDTIAGASLGDGSALMTCTRLFSSFYLKIEDGESCSWNC